ncbi:UbiA family prenyltransferase [Terrabacter aerolatus]|uniref:Transferase n=1 Tax=Terrabacter aerolatus TaxID=422442 RepID=A0A512CZH0_9MICO|nr:UbiA family prenyltransferase [Terrabacter aerolatus]GEO29614.1 transferase [Terrabacter aerolatus]
MGDGVVTSLRDLAELVRAPAALTVPGDTLAGAASAGWPAGPRSVALPVASTCLYWAGMALNDWADRRLDAVERPERPIPSGRVPARTALAVAAGLTVAGVAVAGVGGGRRSAATAAVLAAAVWAYDLAPKEGPVSVATMASTRGLDVLLGASAGGLPGLRAAALPAALVAAHTAGVTALSRGEVHGGSSDVARACVAATAVVAGATAARHVSVTGRARAAGPFGVAASLALTGWYAVSVLGAQLSTVRSPDAGTVRRATGAGIRGLVPLQGAALAAAGHPGAALGLAASAPVGAAAMRRVSAT